MKKFLIFPMMIFFVNNFIPVLPVPVFGVEKGGMNQEKTGLRQYGPVTLGPKTAQEEKDDPYVYITKKGKNYHKESCSHLRGSKIKIRLSEAKRRGYKPCPRCHPQKGTNGAHTGLGTRARDTKFFIVNR